MKSNHKTKFAIGGPNGLLRYGQGSSSYSQLAGKVRLFRSRETARQYLRTKGLAFIVPVRPRDRWYH